MHGPVPETRPMKQPSQPLPVSGLLSSVEAPISATFKFSRLHFGSPTLHSDSSSPLASHIHVDLCEIFEYAHLKFTVSGWSKH